MLDKELAREIRTRLDAFLAKSGNDDDKERMDLETVLMENAASIAEICERLPAVETKKVKWQNEAAALGGKVKDLTEAVELMRSEIQVYKSSMDDTWTPASEMPDGFRGVVLLWWKHGWNGSMDVESDQDVAFVRTAHTHYKNAPPGPDSEESNG